MSFFVGLLAVALLFVIVSNFLPHQKKKSNVNKKVFQEQLLRLFAPGEKLMSTQVWERLEERTGGKSGKLLFSVPPALMALVEEKRLQCQVEHISILGQQIEKKTYSLPEE